MRKLLSLVAVAFVIAALYPQLKGVEATDQSKNLIRNGMFDQDWVAYGPHLVAVNWGTYVISGNPLFGRHGFEQGQQIRSGGPAFVAGIYQEVNGVTPGATYYGYIGTAAKWGAMDSGRKDGHIGRTIGIDPTGGTDPRSPNIVWGSDVWDDAHWNFKDDPSARAPKVWAVARGTKVTLFIKAMYNEPGLEATVWLWDAALMHDASKPIQQPQPPTPTPMPVSAKPARPEADYDVPGGHFYTQASGQEGTGRGFAVTDDSDIPFWSEFQRLGGVHGVGYPTSRRFMWNGYVVQIMQKVVFQWRPEVGQVYFVNIFDEMSNTGKDDWLLNVRSTPKPFDNSPDSGLTWQQIVDRHLTMLDSNQAIKELYTSDSDPINHFGLPMAYVDLGNVEVIRAQRAVIQQWKEDVPWAQAGQVTIANGGDVSKEAGMFGPELTAPEDPPA